MTYGYPDFSRTQAEAGSRLGSYFGQKQTDPTTGIMYVIGYAYLTIQVNDTNNVHNFEMVVTWYDDNAGTNIVNVSTFVPVPGSNVSYQIPTVSKYVRVTCSHQVALDTELIGGIVYGSNVQVTETITGPESGPFIRNSATVPGATNVFVAALYTYWGPADLSWFSDSGANCVVQLEYYDMNTATFVPLRKIHMVAGVNDGNTAVCIPPNPMRIGLYNNNAGAATFTGTVCIA